MIPVYQPLLNGNEKKYLDECIDTGWITSEGPFVEKFEKSFSNFIGAKYGIAVSNGTAAIETALFGAGINPGDEIILPSFTIISCAISILRLGAIPVLVDAEMETWNMDVEKIEAKISSRTKAIMVVHLYGHPVKMDKVFEIAHKYNLIIIEDSAEAHGAEYKGVKCGNLGHISAFSFYSNKLITTGEGGMVLTSDIKMAERAKEYRNLCFQKKRRFLHDDLGYNFRMTNLQAALGVAQMEKIYDLLKIKIELGEYYRKLLSKIKGVQCQTEKEWAKTVYWMYCVVLDESLKLPAKEVMDKLDEEGIGTRPFFLGMHEQPALKKLGLFKNESYPVTEHLAKYGFYLPSSMNLTKKEIDYIVNKLNNILTNAE